MTDLSATMGGSAVVRMEGAISLIDQFPALAGIDLVVDEGEIVLVRGANGAGKSTLLRLCAGLAPLSGGEATVLGYDLSNREQRRRVRRETGLLAHETFLYDELTVEENLLFWATANRVDRSSIEPVLDRLDLAGRLRQVKVSRLSAGQRRRTSLAVMVCRRPKLWLLDEPHGGLDQAGRNFVDDLVQHAIGFGATVLIASHDIDRATDLATRTVIIAGGQIQSPGGKPPPPQRTSSAKGPSANGPTADAPGHQVPPPPGPDSPVGPGLGTKPRTESGAGPSSSSNVPPPPDPAVSSPSSSNVPPPPDPAVSSPSNSNVPPPPPQAALAAAEQLDEVEGSDLRAP